MDMVQAFPLEHRYSNVEFIVSNACEPWPFPNESFDFVHVRFMILSLSAENYLFVLKECMRILKPGGFVQMGDPDFEPWNVCIIFLLERIFCVYVLSFLLPCFSVVQSTPNSFLNV